MDSSMSRYRTTMIDEIDRVKEVKYRLVASCENIGMEVLSEILDDIISQIEKAREQMRMAQF